MSYEDPGSLDNYLRDKEKKRGQRLTWFGLGLLTAVFAAVVLAAYALLKWW